MTVEITRNPVVMAVSLCAAFLCAWIVFIGSKNPPVDRRVSNVALSASGRWLAAGTAQGDHGLGPDASRCPAAAGRVSTRFVK